MAEEKVDKVRDPIYGFIHLDKLEKDIINTRPFQRLKNIKQLSFCYYVYPGAMHTRFEHSLGVMELATKVFDHFRHKGHLDYAIFEKNMKSKELANVDTARRILRLTALLHDIGHLPYSHSAETILPSGQKHEDVSIAIINNSEVTKVIKGSFKSDAKKIIRIITSLLSKDPVPEEFNILKQIISGQFDADRIDYLIRDSRHCGVQYGNFDSDRLIETLRVIHDPEKGGLRLAIDRGGVHCLEALILARYFMFTQVYFHRTRRLYDKYLEHFLAESKYIDIGKDLTKACNYDDCRIWVEIQNQAKSGKSFWAKRLYDRKSHHQLINETSDHADIKELQQMGLLASVLAKYYGNNNIIFDVAPEMKKPHRIHKFYTGKKDKDGEDKKELEELMVVLDDGSEKPLHEESEWLSKGPDTLHVGRLYAFGNEGKIKEIKGKAEEIKRKTKEG